MPSARINGHDMYYEVLGQGDPVLCMGGWGTFCHNNHHQLALGDVHLMGLVGMGACVCQEIAIRRPDLARSMLNMGAWCEVDDFLRDQLEMFRCIHRDLGFERFQETVTLLSFDAEYYNAHGVGFNSSDRLQQIRCPSLIMHAGKEQKIRFAQTLFNWLATN